MTVVLTAVGLVLAVEGLIYALAPQTMRRLMEQMLHSDPERLRIAGVVALAIGVAFIWLGREAFSGM